MDIDAKLDEIIFKYDLDRYYPEYSKMKEAENVVRNVTKGWLGKKILCISTSTKDIRHIKKLQQINGDVEYLHVGSSFDAGFCNRYDCEKVLSKKEFAIYDEVWFISYKGRAFLNGWFYANKIQYSSIYDEFEKIGLLFNHEWDEFIVDCCEEFFGGEIAVDPVVCEIIYLKEKILTSPKDRRSDIYFKLYFLLIYIRDFLSLEEFVHNMPIDIKATITYSYDAIKLLLTDIRRVIIGKKNRCIFTQWIDACSYERLADMPFLSDLRDNNMSFESCYPSTPMTNPSLKAILCSKRTIEDNAYAIDIINEKNSIVKGLLIENGYEFKAIGERWDSLLNAGLTEKIFSGTGHSPCSMILWESLREYIKSSGNVFILSHFLLESHYNVLLNIDMDHSFFDKSISERYKHSLGYLDRQLHYYHNLLSNATNKIIYLSDHANGLVECNWHTFLVLYPYRKKKVEALCSHLDFYKIFSYVLNEKDDDLLLDREYAPLQDLPVYNKDSIKEVLHNKTIIPEIFFSFGYKGCLTKEKVYIHYDLTGNELFIPNNDKYLQSIDARYFLPSWYKGNNYVVAEGIDKYRYQANVDKVIPFTNSKLKYAKLIKAVYEQAYERNALKIQLLNDMISVYSDDTVAIRMGGIHTLYFYKYLFEANRKKIKFIIDENKSCVCSFLGIPIVSKDDVIWDGISAVVLSSKKHIFMLIEEAKGFPAGIDRLDIYEMLASHNLCFKYEFWHFEPNEKEWSYGDE